MFFRLLAIATLGIALIGTGAQPATAGDVTPAYTGSGCGPHDDHTNVPIPDPGTITRTITIIGCQKPSAVGTFTIRIVHPYRGDISISLTNPNGVTYLIKSANPNDSGDNINLPFTISTSVINGTWTLRVTDNYSFDAGYLDMWGLDFS